MVPRTDTSTRPRQFICRVWAMRWTPSFRLRRASLGGRRGALSLPRLVVWLQMSSVGRRTGSGSCTNRSGCPMEWRPCTWLAVGCSSRWGQGPPFWAWAGAVTKSRVHSGWPRCAPGGGTGNRFWKVSVACTWQGSRSTGARLIEAMVVKEWCCRPILFSGSATGWRQAMVPYSHGFPGAMASPCWGVSLSTQRCRFTRRGGGPMPLAT